MAVTPGDAAKINDAAELKAIAEIEAHIDGCLNKSFRTGMSVSISDKEIMTAADGGWTKRAWEEVQNRFRKVGWSIKKKRNRERYGGSDEYVFSATPREMGPTGQRKVSAGPPTQWDVDNEGKPRESCR